MTLNTEGKPNSVNYKEFVTEYYDLLLDNNMVDFNYILFETYKMLHENTRIRKNLSKLIRVICIDEYQDTQELQYQILGLLTKNSTDKTIFIVGDVNQAIYIGIGGVVKNKEELEKIFEREFEEQTLTGCYRSNQQIIDFYKKFMCKEHEIISKNSEYINPIIQVNNSITKESLAPQIAHIINDLIENEKIRPEEICIIAPQWNLLYDFSNKIRELLPDIPFDAPGIIPLKKDEENIIYKISEILLSNFSFYNKNYLERLANEILKQFQDEYSINLNINKKDFLNYCYEIKKIDVTVATDYLKETLFCLFDKLDIKQFFQSQIEEFIQGTIDRIEKYKRYGIEDDKIFFEKALRSKKGIVITTAHGVKGEEYRVVISFALLYGFIPHWDTICNHEERRDSESKKLLYVICSRAKEKLFLFAENNRKTSKGFLYEINPQLMEVKEEIENEKE